MVLRGSEEFIVEARGVQGVQEFKSYGEGMIVFLFVLFFFFIFAHSNIQKPKKLLI